MQVVEIAGVDEAGRGPLAGPVAVGVAVVPVKFNWLLIPDVNDSKQLTESKREEIFELAKDLRQQKVLNWRVAMVGPGVIDTIGIVRAVSLATTRALTRLQLDPKITEVRLDGLLKAPPQFADQKTIIKGDQKEKVIGLASILAKVTRDRYMIRLSQKPAYRAYTFTAHKGYGTKLHRAAIKQYGLSSIHRQSYCQRLIG